MKTHCDYCGCLFHYDTRAHTEYLATPEQKTPNIAAACAQNAWKSIPAQLAPFGTRTVWIIGKTCPGCGSISLHFKDCFPTQHEAEQVVATQNALLETPEARLRVKRWETEVARRIVADSTSLAQLFVTRFPHGKDYLEPSPDGLQITIPSENPAVEVPLTLTVKNAEVLVCWGNGWHIHVHRKQNEPVDSLVYLRQTMEVVENLMDEELIPVESYIDGRHAGGGTFSRKQLGEINWQGQIDALQFRSWRGTFDRYRERGTDGVTIPSRQSS